MKRIIRLTESDLTRVVKRVIKESEESDKYNPIELLDAVKRRKIYPEFIKTIEPYGAFWTAPISSTTGFETNWAIKFRCKEENGLQTMVIVVLTTDKNKSKQIENFYRSATNAPTKVWEKPASNGVPKRYFIGTKFEGAKPNDEDGGNIFYNMIVYAIEKLK
jgi:hypothetical protein